MIEWEKPSNERSMLGYCIGNKLVEAVGCGRFERGARCEGPGERNTASLIELLFPEFAMNLGRCQAMFGGGFDMKLNVVRGQYHWYVEGDRTTEWWISREADDQDVFK